MQSSFLQSAFFKLAGKNKCALQINALGSSIGGNSNCSYYHIVKYLKMTKQVFYVQH